MILNIVDMWIEKKMSVFSSIQIQKEFIQYIYIFLSWIRAFV